MDELREDHAAANRDIASGASTAIGLMARSRPPIGIGELALDRNGRLARRVEDEPLHFTFRYQGFRFDGSIEPGPGALVRLRTDCGYLPYTAESSEARQCVRQIVQESRRLGGARLLISERQVISLESEAVPPLPRTPVSVMSTLVSLLLRNRPLLTLLGDLLGPSKPKLARAV